LGEQTLRFAAWASKLCSLPPWTARGAQGLEAVLWRPGTPSGKTLL